MAVTDSARIARRPGGKKRLGLAALLLAGWLGGCGGGGSAGSSSGGAATATAVPPASTAPTPTPTPGPVPAPAAVPGTTQGSLQAVQPLGRVSVQQVLAAAADARVPAIVPIYDVDTFRISYLTIDSRLQPIVASGLLALPRKGPGARHPVISIQHPTIFRDALAPSNNPSGSEPAVALASMGYAVVAADYVGYGLTRGAPHPYLMAEPMAAAVVDLLIATVEHAQQVGLPLNGQLFLVGYSQGGHATLAAQRALQARGDGFAAAVVGSAPGAGPLDVGATLDSLLQRAFDAAPWLAWLVDPDFVQHLSPSLRQQVRDEMLGLLLPADSDVVFDGRFIDIFLNNDRQAINRDSDVHDWRPDRPVRLFHGRQDETVPFVASTHALQAMQQRGAPDVQMHECSTVPSGHLDCVPEYWQYMLSQLSLAARDL